MNNINRVIDSITGTRRRSFQVLVTTGNDDSKYVEGRVLALLFDAF